MWPVLELKEEWGKIHICIDLCLAQRKREFDKKCLGCLTEYLTRGYPYMTSLFRIGGVKLQLLCGVRIELAVGSLPYPRQAGTPTVWLKGVQPPLGVSRIP